MGKKRRILKSPQKFKAKFGSHPIMKKSLENSELASSPQEEFKPIVDPWKEEKAVKPKKRAATTAKKTAQRKSKKTTKKGTEK